MKGKTARILAAALALLLAAAYGLLPGLNELGVPSGAGRDKYVLTDGESLVYAWNPGMVGSSELQIFLKGLKKGQGMTLTATLTDASGAEAASTVQAVADLGGRDSLLLTGDFRQDETYTLTVAASGDGRISIQGAEDEAGSFQPYLIETGIVESRNPVLLYFAAGLVLLALMPVTGQDPARLVRKKKRITGADLLPWGTFLLILATGLLVDVKKPAFVSDPSWGTWDEDAHMYWVQNMSLLSMGGLRGTLNSVITWHPGYVPLGIGYNLGELLERMGVQGSDLPYRGAVIASTFCYAGMCGLAVRHAPRYKVTFMVAGTIPLMIFQATSMTYDTVVTASVLLGTALLLETLETPARLSTGRAVTLCALLSMGTVAKPAYALALLSLWMIPAEKFGSRKEKWGFRALVLLLAVWCFAAMAMPGAYEDVLGGDDRFSDTDAGAQIRGMLADPIGSGLKPVRYFWEDLRFLTTDWLDFWAYEGFGLSNLAEMYMILMLLVAPLCVIGEHPDGRLPLTWKRRLVWALIAFGAEVLLIYAQYIASSPVGGAITGMQGRYFTPLWAPALLALMWPGVIRWKAKPAGGFMTLLVFGICCWANVANAVIHLARVGAL